MTNSEVKELMVNELSCVLTADANGCDRDCGKCPLVRDTADIVKAYEIVISMFKED